MLNAGYIGDDLTGTGFRLAGVNVHPVPDSIEQLWQLIMKERKRRHLVILSADCAELIHEPLERLLTLHPLPPVVVLPGTPGEPDAVVNAAFDALGLEGPVK